MATETVENKPTKPQQTGGVTLPQVDHNPLPCPRCESINTKFCYYNNYNFSQPRHFCKACRRYWTQGGTLRDIPIGGGTRKTAKRCRTSSSFSSSSSSSSSSTSVIGSGSGLLLDPLQASHVFTEATPAGGASFTSLLSNGGSGILLGGFGVDDVGFGFQRGVCPFPAVGYENGRGVNGFGVGGVNEDGNVNRGDTWQAGSGEHGFGVTGGDCISYLPELVMSTTGSAMK